LIRGAEPGGAMSAASQTAPVKDAGGSPVGPMGVVGLRPGIDAPPQGGEGEGNQHGQRQSHFEQQGHHKRSQF
jgi:hypothetical protein